MVNFALKGLEKHLIFTALVSYGSFAESITHRPILQKKLHQTICDSSSSTLKPSTFWDQQIFDSHIELHTMRKDQLAFSLSSLDRAGKLLAHRHFHHGYAAGICTNGKGWVATTPAPNQIISHYREILSVDISAANSCKKILIDFIGHSGPSRKIATLTLPTQKRTKINTKFLSDGTLSLTCFPTASSIGPYPWIILPVKQGPAPTVPHQMNKGSNGELTSKIFSWINLVRSDEGLQPLQNFSTNTEILIKKNITPESIMHHRPTLRKLTYALKTRGIKFVGENKAKGTDASNLTWILWNSPRHRSLLLNRKATHLFISSKKIQNQFMTVLIFAKTNQKML